MIHRFRRLGVVVLSIGCMCLVAACGSSSKSGSGSSATNPAGHFTSFKLTTTQRACLKQKGVTIPTGSFRRGGAAGSSGGGTPPNGKFPKGRFRKGKFPKGKLPKNGTPPAGFAGQNSKRLAAFKACGVSFPSRPAGGAPPSTTGG
jgi:hypothetical protein